MIARFLDGQITQPFDLTNGRGEMIILLNTLSGSRRRRGRESESAEACEGKVEADRGMAMRMR